MRKKLEHINLKRDLNEALEIKSIQDIEALFNISWEEGVQGPQLDPVTLQHLKFLPEKKKDNIFRQIAKNQKNLALVCMDDDLGYGVFAKADIPGGTFITTYGGAQVDFQSNNHQASDYNICGNEQGLRFGVNAANHRNWGGFLQHLPGTDLNDYVFDCAETRKSVATANVKVSLYQYKGCKGQSSWGFFIRTERDISAGEILGYDYGNVHNAQDRTFSKMVAPKSYDYWRIAQKTPLLFDTFGKKIAISAYRFVGRLSLLFYDEKQSVITHRLWASEIKSIHNKSVYMITNHLFVSAKAILQKIEENPGSPWLSFFELKTNYIVTEKIKVALFCNDVFVQEPSSLEKIDQLAADENNHRPICITVRNESNVIDIYAASREQFMKAYEQ